MKLMKLTGLLMLVAGSSAVLMAFPATPELDPSSVASVGLLLGGVLLVVRSRKR